MAELTRENRLNKEGSRPIRDRSNFAESCSYRFAGTYRFGELSPHYAAVVVPSEDHTFRCAHTLRSYTMENPLEQSAKLHKDYFMVPLPAILPINHDKFINIPNFGDDVDPEEVGTTVKNFPDKLYGIMNNARIDAVTANTWTDFFRFVIAYDMMYSRGSLLKFFGYTIGGKMSDAQTDAFWSAVVAYINASANNVILLNIGSDQFYIVKQGSNSSVKTISLHEAISRMRDDFSFTITANAATPPSNVIGVVPNYIPGQGDESPMDFQPYFAYQLVCSHFYSNDHVDAIINADLYRQNLRALIETCSTGATTATFLYNGVNTVYDTCSAYMFNCIYNDTVVIPGTTNWVDIFDYLRLIFGFNRSLRFGDYFTGSRTRPLGIGPNNAVDVQVNNNMVNVVDIIQKSWMARLLAQVARVGRRTPEQAKAQFPETNIAQDWHEPIWLGDTAFDIFAEQIDNTSTEQYSKDISTTSVWLSKNEGYAFKCSVPNYNCIIIGLTWFDISRFYTEATERTFFHQDRFDKFQPMLQFDGDQKIYLRELRPTSGLGQTFGYTGKYMEYKQRFNQAAGGFANGALPGIIFTADNGRVDYDVVQQNSDYIRSYPSEIDSLYPRLTGFSLGTYFHFWIINDNYDDASKPMAFNPQLM